MKSWQDNWLSWVYRGSGEVLKREEFEARKLAAEANKQSKKNQQQ